jgi:hypothetical protein
MATVKHPISEHDVIVLRDGVGGWSASTTGAVISVYDPGREGHHRCASRHVVA